LRVDQHQQLKWNPRRPDSLDRMFVGALPHRAPKSAVPIVSSTAGN
jgi:hypothetical protein